MNTVSHTPPEDCREIFEKLSEFLDGDLPPDICGEIERHIAGCPPCVEFVASLRRSIELCHKYRAETAPGPLDPAARERLQAAYRKMIEGRQKA